MPLLFGVNPGDRSALVSAATLMGGVGIVAMALPVWRAMRLTALNAVRAA